MRNSTIRNTKIVKMKNQSPSPQSMFVLMELL